MFIIGLFSGDGTLSLTLENSKSTLSKLAVRISLTIAVLKNSDGNKHLLNLIANTLGLHNKSLNWSTIGIDRIALLFKNRKDLNYIINLFMEHKVFFFLKKDELLTAAKLLSLMEDKKHLEK